ncbi:MAG: RNA 3'-terminal phosphate cyclase [Thermoprotei archaeon]
MIEVDGSTMEGGGQILRTAVSLSAATRSPVLVHSIRANRKPSGLRPQHLAAIRAAADVCSAKLEGARIGSSQIVFEPQDIKGGDYEFDVGTAGSVTLVLQTLLPIMVFSGQRFTVRVKGGTNVMSSPSVDYFEHIFLFHLAQYGARCGFRVVRRGFYPVGGGEVELIVNPSSIGRVSLTERGENIGSFAISGASRDLQKARVAERQLQYVEADEKRVEYVDTPSTGSYVFVARTYSKTRHGCDAVGRRGLRAEEVGKSAWGCLIRQDGVLDEFMSDQIIPYIALFGGRAIIEGTTHSKTNLYVCSLFPVRNIAVSELGNGELLLEAN